MAIERCGVRVCDNEYPIAIFAFRLGQGTLGTVRCALVGTMDLLDLLGGSQHSPADEPAQIAERHVETGDENGDDANRPTTPKRRKLTKQVAVSVTASPAGGASSKGKDNTNM